MVFLVGYTVGIFVVIPINLMRSSKKQNRYMFIFISISFILTPLDLTVPPIFYCTGIVIALAAHLSRYFTIHDQHTSDYLCQLNDKMKETESWHKLIKNLPEAIACFDSEYDSLYLNRAAKRIFKVKDESKMRDKTETTITTSMDMSK